MVPPRVPLTVDTGAVTCDDDGTRWRADSVWLGSFTGAGATRTTVAPAAARTLLAPAPDRQTGAKA